VGYDLDTHALYVYHNIVTEKAVATLILQIILLLSTSHTTYLGVDLHTTCSNCRNVHEKNYDSLMIQEIKLLTQY
jgi:hypothetical protein